MNWVWPGEIEDLLELAAALPAPAEEANEIDVAVVAALVAGGRNARDAGWGR